jgi:hypothetical protein
MFERSHPESDQLNKKNTGVQEFRSSGVQDSPEPWTKRLYRE